MGYVKIAKPESLDYTPWLEFVTDWWEDYNGEPWADDDCLKQNCESVNNSKQLRFGISCEDMEDTVAMVITSLNGSNGNRIAYADKNGTKEGICEECGQEIEESYIELHDQWGAFLTRAGYEEGDTIYVWVEQE